MTVFWEFFQGSNEAWLSPVWICRYDNLFIIWKRKKKMKKERKKYWFLIGSAFEQPSVLVFSLVVLQISTPAELIARLS